MTTPPYLARKVKRAKWDRRNGLAEGEISSHAVTVDLRASTSCALSFWRCGDASEGAVRQVVLAIASGAERVDPVEVTWLSWTRLKDQGVVFEQTAGRTPVRSLVEEHVDAVNLDLTRLGIIAQEVSASLDDERFVKLTKKEVTDLLAHAVRDGSMPLAALSEDVRLAVEKVAVPSVKKKPKPTT